MTPIRSRLRVDTVLPAVALVVTLVLFGVTALITGRSIRETLPFPLAKPR